MILDLTEQEHQYLLQVLLERPVKEALPMVLKITGQKLVQVDAGPTNVTPITAVN